MYKRNLQILFFAHELEASILTIILTLNLLCMNAIHLEEIKFCANMRMQLLSLSGILVLSFMAEKCRQFVGEEHSLRNRTERFTFTDCFDMSYGTAACVFKEIIKLYLYYARAVFVHKAKAMATQKALTENLAKHMDFERAVAAAREEGKTAARKASWQVKHVTGPLLSAGWDLFETIYAGGSAAEGIVRFGGTFVGAYGGGIAAEGKIGWLGFVVGSQFGSWIGGRIGLMAYDVGICVQYLLQRMSGKNINVEYDS